MAMKYILLFHRSKASFSNNSLERLHGKQVLNYCRAATSIGRFNSDTWSFPTAVLWELLQRQSPLERSVARCHRHQQRSVVFLHHKIVPARARKVSTHSENDYNIGIMQEIKHDSLYVVADVLLFGLNRFWWLCENWPSVCIYIFRF